MNDKGYMGSMLKKSGLLMKQLRSRVKAEMGDSSRWSADTLAASKNVLGGVSVYDVNKLSPEAVKGALADLRDVVFEQPFVKAAMGKKVIDALGGMSSASKWSSADIVK